MIEVKNIADDCFQDFLSVIVINSTILLAIRASIISTLKTSATATVLKSPVIVKLPVIPFFCFKDLTQTYQTQK